MGPVVAGCATSDDAAPPSASKATAAKRQAGRDDNKGAEFTKGKTSNSAQSCQFDPRLTSHASKVKNFATAIR